MFKLGDLVKIAEDNETSYEIINVKKSGLIYDLKRDSDILVLKNVPYSMLISSEKKSNELN